MTPQGIKRLEESIALAQEREKSGSRFTQAELSERVKLSIKTIKKIRERKALTDENSVRALFSAFDLKLETSDYGQSEPSSLSGAVQAANKRQTSNLKIDWGEKPDTAIFFGRTEDLMTLSQWVMAEQCRVVTLLGMGGIGKTSLAAKLADQIYDQFDYVIWRSLREAPPLDEILVRLIQFLSDQQETEINLPSRLGERIIRLLHYLRQHRCLLVLDNLESILQAEPVGQFREGYEGYGELIHRIGSTEHQSCLLLTSRECPRELAPMAGDRLPVRLWSVVGIDDEAGREILKTKGLNLDETDNQSQELLRRYSGNPQALHLVATAIQREFLGDVNDFLEDEGAAVEDVRSLLDQHLARLAPLERSILFWLAINREPVGMDELMEDLLPPVTKREVRSALRGLSDRYLIETVGKQFTLQNVIIEFTTDRFVEQVINELNAQQFDLFNTHALIKATSKDYVRETQLRLVLNPVSVKFSNLQKLVNSSLKSLRENQYWRAGYAAGNLLNLLGQTQPEISHLDLSHLIIRQAYLQGTRLNVNFSNSKLLKAALTYPFGQIHSIAFSPDGQFLAAGSSNATIRLWDIQRQQCVHTFIGHTAWVSSVVFSPDSRRLATGSDDATIRLWDVEQRRCICTFSGHYTGVYAVAFSPDGQWLATGSGDATIRLWDIEQQQCIRTLTGSKSIRSVAFSPDGQLLATVSDGSKISLLNVHQLKCIHEITESTTSVAFSPDGQWLATGGRDGTVRLWSVRQQEFVHTFIGHSKSIRSVAFSPDGLWLATGSIDTTIRLWNFEQRQCAYTFNGHTDWVRAVAFSPDGELLATADDSATIRLWDVEQRKCVQTLIGHTTGVRAVAFDPTGQQLATSGRDTIVQLWNIEEQKCIQAFNGHNTFVSMDFSPDGNWLATSGSDATIRLWNIKQQQCIKIFSGHTAWVDSVVFSPDGQWLATGSGDRTTRLWNVEQQQCIHVFTGHTSGIRSVAFSADGKWLATGSADTTIRLWNIEQRKSVQTFIGHTDWIRSVAFSPSGKWMATGSRDATVRLWDIERQKCTHTFTEHAAGIYSVAFSPDGHWMVTGSADATVRLWDIERRKCIYTFTDHTAEVYSVVFSPDGCQIATGSGDATVRLWDVKTGACLSILSIPKLYQGTNISGVKGLTEIERTWMLALGAVD